MASSLLAWIMQPFRNRSCLQGAQTASNEKGSKKENGKVASPKSVPIHHNPIALRMAKLQWALAVLSAIGLMY